MALVNPNHPIHPSFDERISVKVEGQLPQFVKEDHTTFVSFMEAYYEYLEQTGKPYEIIGNLHNYSNVDKTTDEFLKYFKTQFGNDIPEAVFTNANKSFILKHLRDFYRNKGSEKSFQFLFRLLYKEEIDFYYPGKDMLRVSDGRYNKSEIIRVIDTSGSDAVFNLTGKKITGTTSGSTAIVETIVNENIGTFVVSTIFLSGVVGIFSIGEVISDGENSFITGGMVTDYTITNPGNNYSLGSVIPITNSGVSTAGTFIKVDTLSTGWVSSYTINSGGTGYVVGDKLTIDNTNNMALDGRTASILVKEVDGSGTITSLEIEHGGRGYKIVPVITGGGTGTNVDVTLLGSGIGGIKTLNIVNGGYGYTSDSILDFSSLGDGTATGVAKIGAYEDSFSKGFSSDDGFLSAPKYIQDSKYYQLFSYVLKCENTIDRWRDVIKRIVHPAGLSLFGNFQMVSRVNTGLKITGIPQRRDYKIIFHSGAVPPVVLNLKVDSCEGRTIEYYPVAEDDEQEEDTTLSNSNNISSTQDDGFLPEGGTLSVDDGSIVRDFYYAPTKCQIYEKDLPIQKLTKFTAEDYLEDLTTDSHLQEPNPNDDYGLVTAVVNQSAFEDWGDLHSKTQLQLGPLKRTIEKQKFNKFGGFSQKIGVATQSGSPIVNFKDETVDNFIMMGGSKTRTAMNSTITQYLNGTETTGYTGHPDEPNEDNIGTTLEGVSVPWEPQTNDPTPAERVLPPS